MNQLNKNNWERLRTIAREEAQRMERDELPRSLGDVIPDVASRMSFDDVLKWLTMVHQFAGHRVRPRQPFIETNMKL